MRIVQLFSQLVVLQFVARPLKLTTHAIRTKPCRAGAADFGRGVTIPLLLVNLFVVSRSEFMADVIIPGAIASILQVLPPFLGVWSRPLLPPGLQNLFDLTNKL